MSELAQYPVTYAAPQPAADWESANPILALFQFGQESDMGGIKIGDGVTAWNDLPFFTRAGVKVYRATLTQTGTDAPVATVLENTFGAELVWTRVEAGLYRATLAGAFPSNRTVVLHNTPPASFGLVCSAGRGSDNVVDVLVAAINVDFGEETFAWQGQDDILGLNFYIEILVYP